MSKIVVVDLSAIETINELHQLLAEKLSFPDFYGNNWDAFWDSITGLVEMPKQLELVGFSELEKKLSQDANQLRSCLKEMKEQYPQIQCEVSYA